MFVKKEIDFEDLKDLCWDEALDTLETIEEHGKENEFMAMLEEEYQDDIPSLTEVNDFLWFEDDFIFDRLEIDLENE